MSDKHQEQAARAKEISESSINRETLCGVLAHREQQLAEAKRDLAEARERFESQGDYAIALQRLIERYCRGDLSGIDRKDCPHHYDMLAAKLAAR